MPIKDRRVERHDHREQVAGSVPGPHGQLHEHGGSQEISVTGLSGVLADEQDAGQIKGDDVNTTGVADNNVLVYDSASGNWLIGDHGGIGGLGDDDHTQYLLADGTRNLGGNLNIGTYSLGDGTGTLVFDGSGNLALNGGSFDIDAGKTYGVGGNVALYQDATNYVVKLGYLAGYDAGKNASGAVNHNTFIGGGRQAGENCTGDVKESVFIGSPATGYALGRAASAVGGIFCMGEYAGYRAALVTTNQAIAAVLIGRNAGGWMLTASTGGLFQGILGLGERALYQACYANTSGNAYYITAIGGEKCGEALGRQIANGKTLLRWVGIGAYAGYQFGDQSTDHIYDNTLIGDYAGYQWGRTDAGIQGNILLGTYAGYGGSGNYHLIITSQQGSDFADNKARAIIWGQMSTTTADQTLFLHATTQIGVGGTDYIEIDDTGHLTAGGAGKVSLDKLHLLERSSDPADPAEGETVVWMSDGTGSGDDGDIMMKITAGGSTKTVTLVDFSAA